MMKVDPSERSAKVEATTRNEHIDFKVAACMNAKVALVTERDRDDSRYYEIGIGDSNNTKITIFDSDSGPKCFVVLSCVPH